MILDLREDGGQWVEPKELMTQVRSTRLVGA